MLSTLRTWLRGLFGRGGADADDDTTPASDADGGIDAGGGTAPAAGTDAAGGTEQGATPEPAAGADALTCAICGTANPDDATACSLCGASDLRPATDAGTDADADGGDGEGETGLSGGATRTERVRDDADADRLRSVRAEGELLVEHRDRWAPLPHEDGFRVTLPDGERVVGSRDEVRELLRAVETGDDAGSADDDGTDEGGAVDGAER